MREPNYRFFAMAFVCSSTGLQMLSTAIGWEIFERTGNALDLGLMGLARALPVIALTLPAGTLVDRGNRKVILSVTQVAFGLVALGLAVASHQHAPVWVFLALLLVSGCVRSFNAPSRGALLPSLLSPERFENAIAWQSGFFQFAAVAGPLIAGVLLAKMGVRLSTQQAAKFVPVVGQAASALLTYSALKLVCEQHIRDCQRMAQILALPPP